MVAKTRDWLNSDRKADKPEKYEAINDRSWKRRHLTALHIAVSGKKLVKET